MKWLKLFEEHSEYYQEIEYYEFDREVSRSDNTLPEVKLKDYEFSQLNKILTKDRFIVEYKLRERSTMLSNRWVKSWTLNVRLSNKHAINKSVDVYKREDEWFYVWAYRKSLAKGKYYKCDQLSGLIDFLKDFYKEELVSSKKLFEAFTKEEYYKEINNTEYHNEFNRLVRFTSSEVKKIANMISEEYSGSCGYANVHFYKNSDGDFTNMAHQIKIVGDTFVYFISKKEDDWYIVEKVPFLLQGYANRTGKYYLCDQWEGLVRLLNDEQVLKK